MLRICLDARITSGKSGGIEQVIIGLAYGLSQLTDGDEEYYFLSYSERYDWLKPYITGPNRILISESSYEKPFIRNTLKSSLPPIYKLINSLYPLSGRWKVRDLSSDGTIEKARIDIMHFTQQMAFFTKTLSIYHPHDLQHKHLKANFSFTQRFLRDLLDRTFCSRAEMVAVATSWVKDDVLKQYPFTKGKVQVVPLAPPTSAYQKPKCEDIIKVRNKFSLPKSFVFYPAQTWAHKNHLGLLEAIAILKQRNGITVPAVFAGSMNEAFYPKIEQIIQKLCLTSQTYFLDFVDPIELQCLYRLAKCVVIPTKYEAGSFPLWEAFLAGVPVSCSNVTSLPAQAGDAAIVFNPDNPKEIADAILRLYTDESLCEVLIQRGLNNVSLFSWKQTARIFRAHYRRLARRSLGPDDQNLLASLPKL